MPKNEEKMPLPKVTIDDFFTTQEERDNKDLEKVVYIPINEILDFPNHPFKVRDDEKMLETVESVKEHGVLVPAIIRKKDNGQYEMVAGHRRKRACELAQIDTIPCIIRDLTDDQATIIMVDSNLQREQILPSERAFAYKMKLEAEKHQGIKTTCGQDVHKSRDDIAEDMSGRQVQRYIRLTELIPELLELVDNQVINEKESLKMALLPAVELSYLKEEEQYNVLDVIDCLQATPSHAQTRILREKSEKGELDFDTINEILSEEKPNQKEQVKFSYEKVKDYFPKGYTVQQMQGVIEKLLQKYQLQWQNKQYER